MGTLLGRVLVIDDDPFMLRAISEQLVRAGFQVVERESAAGATQVIVAERVDVAVIDWNLPGLNGDDVVRLLRTWDEVKDLPVVLISGAPSETLATIREQLPGIHVLSKESLRDELLRTIGYVVASGKTVRGLVPVQVDGRRDTMPPRPRRKSSDLVPQLLADVAEVLPKVRAAWSDVAGKREGVGMLTDRLDRLAGQAELLALNEAADLLRELCSTLRALPRERKVPRQVKQAVESSMIALSTLQDSDDGAFTVPPEPLIDLLRRAREELVSAN